MIREANRSRAVFSSIDGAAPPRFPDHGAEYPEADGRTKPQLNTGRTLSPSTGSTLPASSQAVALGDQRDQRIISPGLTRCSAQRSQLAVFRPLTGHAMRVWLPKRPKRANLAPRYGRS